MRRRKKMKAISFDPGKKRKRNILFFFLISVKTFILFLIRKSFIVILTSFLIKRTTNIITFTLNFIHVHVCGRV